MHSDKETLEFILKQDVLLGHFIISAFLHKTWVRKMFGGTWYLIEDQYKDHFEWSKIPFHITEKNYTLVRTEKYNITGIDGYIKIIKYIFAYIKK